MIWCLYWWHSWWHLSINVGPTQSRSVTDTNVPVASPGAGIRAMEGDRARLSATDRPAAFRIENLGSCLGPAGRLGDGFSVRTVCGRFGRETWRLGGIPRDRLRAGTR